MQGNTVTRVLTADPFRVFDWRNPRGIASTRVVTITASQGFLAPAGGAGASALPRVRLTWGVDRARQSVDFDLPGKVSIGIVASALSVDVFSEQEDPVTPTAMTGPRVDLAIHSARGFAPAVRLDYTTRIYDCDTANSDLVPAGATDVRAELATSAPNAGGLPLFYFGVHHEWRTATTRVHACQIQDMIREPLQIGRSMTGFNAPGYRRIWQNTACNAANTEQFRLVFGIQI